MSAILLKGGTIVTSSGKNTADVLIKEEKVHSIGKDLPISNDTKVIDVSNRLLFPGGIDPHVHLEVPVMDTNTADDFRTGSIAALFGGTTTFIDFFTQEKDKSLVEIFDSQRKLAEKSLCDYSFHCSINHLTPKIREEISELKSWGCSSIKVYLAYKNTLMIEDPDLIELFQIAKSKKLLLIAHCENGDAVTHLTNDLLKNKMSDAKYHPSSRPVWVEAEATYRFLSFSKLYNIPVYVVHVTCGEAISVVRYFQNIGHKVFGEVCIPHLLLDESKYELPNGENSKYVLSPPLRTQKDIESCWNALRTKVLQVVSSDHCPFNFVKDKLRNQDSFNKIPNGMPGIEQRISLLYTYGVQSGRITLEDFVNCISTSPAKMFGLYPDKGTIQVGSDADIVIFDPEKKGILSVDTHHSDLDYNPYEGVEVKGVIEKVFLRGKLVVDGKKILAKENNGKYLVRNESYCLS